MLGAIPLLSEEEREGMRVAGRFNAEIIDQLRPLMRPGITTGEIDRFVHGYTVTRGHIPAPLGYTGPIGVPFPGSCCVSVNDVVCHGIPGDYELQDGDIVNVDVSTIVDGWHGDSSETFLIGEVDEEAKRLVRTTLECLHLGIRAARPGGRVGAISAAITHHARQAGFSVVQIFTGHGIGRQFHQAPTISHFGLREDVGAELLPGMCFTIEPMLNAGTPHCNVDVLGDGWTATTGDGEWSAQFEHTILMTEDGPEILTLTKEGPQP